MTAITFTTANCKFDCIVLQYGTLSRSSLQPSTRSSVRLAWVSRTDYKEWLFACACACARARALVPHEGRYYSSRACTMLLFLRSRARRMCAIVLWSEAGRMAARLHDKREGVRGYRCLCARNNSYVSRWLTLRFERDAKLATCLREEHVSPTINFYFVAANQKF